MNEESKLIMEQWDKLPPNLQQALKSVPWKILVQDVGKENALDAEQIASLEQETMFILYAFENPKDFVSNIVKAVGVTEGVAEEIAQDVADKIFDPILEKSGGGGEIIHPGLPMVEKNEVAHTVPHEESPKPKIAPKSDLPDYRYPEGRDPYREPMA